MTNTVTKSPALWESRANQAEHSVTERFMRRLWTIPGTRLALSGKPATPQERSFAVWNYWWQAHVLDCLIDAYTRSPSPFRKHQIKRFARAHLIRNLGTPVNSYYDDMAWMGLALERATRLVGLTHPKALNTLRKQFEKAWSPDLGGGMPWRKQDWFFNTPANGPIGIFLARANNYNLAEKISTWIFSTLLDAKTGLIIDGIDDKGKLHEATFTYCQGVVLGLETELYQHDHDKKHLDRILSLLKAIDKNLATNGIMKMEGGGDGGLFTGILARYLALTITELPNDSKQLQEIKKLAAKLIFASAEAAWNTKIMVEGSLVFSADWNKTAQIPKAFSGGTAKMEGNSVSESHIPERDLTVQTSAWMLLEAAYKVAKYQENTLVGKGN